MENVSGSPASETRVIDAPDPAAARAAGDLDEVNGYLGRLEERVDAAVALITDLTDERDELRARVDERDAELEDLRGQLEQSSASGPVVDALRQERDELLRDRTSVIHRVEAILERLNGLDLG